MKYLIFILLILNSFKAQSQRKSIFYNEKQQFYLDTNLTITKTQYKFWSHAESNLLAVLSQINFPQIYFENNIKSKGILIASFICDSIDIKEVVTIQFPR